MEKEREIGNIATHFCIYSPILCYYMLNINKVLQKRGGSGDPKNFFVFLQPLEKRAVMRTLFTLRINGAPQKHYSTKITYL